MRTLGSMLTVFLLVMLLHCTILLFNPGIADVRHTAPRVALR